MNCGFFSWSLYCESLLIASVFRLPMSVAPAKLLKPSVSATLLSEHCDSGLSIPALYGVGRCDSRARPKHRRHSQEISRLSQLPFLFF